MMLVVDTNVIIAGLLKDSTTRKILFHPFFIFLVPESVFAEIESHRDELMAKSGLTRHRYHQVMDAIRERLVLAPEEEIADSYREAFDLMCGIDETDAPFVALAISSGAEGIWSNDGHLQRQSRVRVWTTREMVAEMAEMDDDVHRG